MQNATLAMVNQISPNGSRANPMETSSTLPPPPEENQLHRWGVVLNDIMIHIRYCHYDNTLQHLTKALWVQPKWCTCTEICRVIHALPAPVQLSKSPSHFSPSHSSLYTLPVSEHVICARSPIRDNLATGGRSGFGQPNTGSKQKGKELWDL